MNSYKIIIVEDEVLIAETIKLYLEEKGHQVPCICISFEEAIQSIEQHSADIYLLDIRLYGEKSGIDVAKHLKEKHIPFIFLTSQYDDRIVQSALTTKPYGYITKPIQKESLWTTVASSYELFKNDSIKSNIVEIYDGHRKHIIHEKEIFLIESDHVYAHIFTMDGNKITTRSTLTHILEKLKSACFFQCHRSYIINLDHVKTYDFKSVTVKNETIPVSRSRKDALKQKLG